MNEKPRKGWLVIAFMLGLWLCMLFAVSSVIFTMHTDEDLTRVRGCRAYGEPIWRYVSETDVYHQSVTSMSQKDLATHEFSCSIT